MISADIDIFQIRSMVAGYGGDLGQSQTKKYFECWINNINR